MTHSIKLLPVLILLLSCSSDDDAGFNLPDGIDPRNEMREFVIGISEYSKELHPAFLVIPQNGIELVTNNGEEEGKPESAYLQAIDGNGQEDLYYGYEEDDMATPAQESEYLEGFLNISLQAGNTILVTDYCSTVSHMERSYSESMSNGYISFAADDRELNRIPAYPSPIHQENDRSVSSLAEVSNFLYLINPEDFSTKAEFIAAIKATNYDLLIMDLFFNDNTEFSAEEINALKEKANGGSRFVISYMSIGEAEDYRYYWQPDWQTDKPSWLEGENPDWPGNYKVKYWEKDWQKIIFGNESSYLKKILDADFDGVYLDIIDAYEYFE